MVTGTSSAAGKPPEPGCPTHPPDGYPGAEGLADLKRAVVQEQADLGLALDGDAGRFGVIDRDGSYISPNEVIYMLLHYLTEYRNWRGALTRTVATTHMIDRIADDYGLPVVETPVGFKYIGQSLIKHRSILVGEESGGLSIQGHIPEQDGIVALALVVEMVSFRGKSLLALPGRDPAEARQAGEWTTGPRSPRMIWMLAWNACSNGRPRTWPGKVCWKGTPETVSS